MAVGFGLAISLTIAKEKIGCNLRPSCPIAVIIVFILLVCVGQFGVAVGGSGMTRSEIGFDWQVR